MNHNLILYYAIIQIHGSLRLIALMFSTGHVKLNINNNRLNTMMGKRYIRIIKRTGGWWKPV